MTGSLVERLDLDSLPVVLEADLDHWAFQQTLLTEVVALDIETTGLDWRRETIGTVQLQVADATYVVRPGGRVPRLLKAILEDRAICKLFHHAMFDLRFLAHHWGVTPANVACTKISSKLADPELPRAEHSLAPLLERSLGIRLDKGARTSDWTGDLSEAQLRYAANDVRHLTELHWHLEERLRERGLLELRNRCYAHLPTQVELEVGEFPDVFAY